MEQVEDPGDSEYLVTADMLIHEDMDDERTLEEEEGTWADEANDQEELQDLQKEQDMPLDDLLAMYYGSGRGSEESTSSVGGVAKDEGIEQENEGADTKNEGADTKNEGADNKNEEVDNKNVGVALVQPVRDPSPTHVPPDLLLPAGLMEDVDPAPNTSSTNKSSGRKRAGQWVRSGADPQALARLRPVPERLSLRMFTNEGEGKDSTFTQWLNNQSLNDSDSDEEYTTSWKKEIRMGRDHQATVPAYFSPVSSESIPDTLQWDPQVLHEDVTEGYLVRVNSMLQERAGLPSGSTHRDNELALRTLQSCDHNTDKAVDMFREDTPHEYGMLPWSDDERKLFETGLQSIGKDFNALQKQIPSRTVKELVQYYYYWKKTEHYDVFLQTYGKMGKKKFSLPPGYLSDFMNDYLDPSHTDYPDLHYGTTTLSAEVKKDRHASLQQVDARLNHTPNFSKSISARTS